MNIKPPLKRKVYRKILKFFHENPSSIDTPRGISAWINEEIGKVRPALKRLAEAGFLVAHKVSSTTGYCYTRNRKKIAAIKRLLNKG